MKHASAQSAVLNGKVLRRQVAPSSLLGGNWGLSSTTCRPRSMLSTSYNDDSTIPPPITHARVIHNGVDVGLTRHLADDSRRWWPQERQTTHRYHRAAES